MLTLISDICIYFSFLSRVYSWSTLFHPPSKYISCLVKAEKQLPYSCNRLYYCASAYGLGSFLEHLFILWSAAAFRKACFIKHSASSYERHYINEYIHYKDKKILYHITWKIHLFDYTNHQKVTLYVKYPNKLNSSFKD